MWISFPAYIIIHTYIHIYIIYTHIGHFLWPVCMPLEPSLQDFCTWTGSTTITLVPGYWPDTQVTVICRPWFGVWEAREWNCWLDQAPPSRNLKVPNIRTTEQFSLNISQTKYEYKLIKSGYSVTHYKTWYTIKDNTAHLANIIKRLT